MLFTSDLLEGEVPEDGLSVMRQSWKRYDMEAVLNNRYVVPSIPYESALSETDDRQVTTRLDEDGKQKGFFRKGFSRYQHYCSFSLSKKDIERRKATTTDELLIRLLGNEQISELLSGFVGWGNAYGQRLYGGVQ